MTSALTNAGIVFAFFAVMEGVAWTFHRFVMHGWLWCLHEDHHDPTKKGLERNDWFVVFFAMPAIILFVVSISVSWTFWAALGVTLYGAMYIVFHDVIVHRRVKTNWKFKNPYMRHIIRAHRIHHAVRGKEGAVSFGFLVAPPIAHLKARLRRGGKSLRKC